jgi:hypothetical protein
MPRGGKKMGTRDHRSRERLDAVCSFLSPNRKLSIRSCLYRLSAMYRPGSSTEKLYPGTDKLSYRSLKELIRVVRITGERDEELGGAMDDCFIDNKRVMVEGETDGWENIAAYMEPPDPRGYKRNPWQDQPDRIHVWVEKDTLRGLIQGPCFKWDVTHVISMGTFGRTILMRAAERIAEAINSGCRRIFIFYIGDFDPSGLAIEEWAQFGNEKEGNRRTEGLLEIIVNRHGWTLAQYKERIVFRRVAVTEYDFLSNPGLEPMKISIKDAGLDEETGKCKKGNDPRAVDYKKQYGDRCLEAEALEVLKDGEISDRLDLAIQGAIDLDAWAANERKQKREIQRWINSH